MKGKAAIIVAILILNAAYFAQIVAAADPIVPVEIDVSVDFTGERSFKLIFPNGGTKVYSWTAGQTHADETFEQTIYWNLDEDEYCTDSVSTLNEYKNITGSLVDMLDICGDAIVSNNESKTLYDELAILESDRNQYLIKFETEKDKYETCTNNSDTMSSQVTEYKRDYERCQTQLLSAQKDSSSLKTCTEDLADANSSKSNNMFIGGAVGLVAGWFIWGRKKKSGPSEHSEAGSGGDHIDYDRYRIPDGPRR